MKGKANKGAGKKGAIRVTLGSAQTIREVSQLRDQLDTLITSAERIEIDGGALERVDTACLQLLTAFHRDATARGIDVTWLDTTPELVRVTQLLGLTQALQLQAKG